MEFVDDPLTNPDLVTQVRINTVKLGNKELFGQYTIVYYCQFVHYLV